MEGQRQKALGQAAASLPPGLADHPDYQVIRELDRERTRAIYSSNKAK